MCCEQCSSPRELNRLDIKNRKPLPASAEEQVLRALDAKWPLMNALVVLDQVSEANCGVITERVRQQLAQLGQAEPEKFLIADSRKRAGLFRFVSLKPNRKECAVAAAMPSDDLKMTGLASWTLACKTQRPV